MMNELLFRIGDHWEPGETGALLEDINPSDQREVLARYRLMGQGQVERAMQAALNAFASWRARSPIARAAIVSKAADLLRSRCEQYARMIALENGKTLAEASVEVDKSAHFLDFYAATARMPGGAQIADARSATRSMTLIEPIGTLAVVTPWNDPMLTPARKLAPALMSGNTMVFKPARETPLAACALVRALVDAGLPGGVLNLVVTDHDTFAETVLAHPKLAGLTFTGSTEVGLALSHRLAGRNVRLQTEMGGNNASVVLEDADLDLAATTIVSAAFGQAGQRCTATSRVIVQDKIHDALVEKLVGAVSRLCVGASLNPSTSLGPVINRQRQCELLKHIECARARGGHIVCGGRIPQGEDYVHGCFLEPTIVTHVTSTMPLWQEEVFGPVLAVNRVNTFEQALEAVNDSGYGLSAAIFTNNLQYTERFIAAVDTGQVAVNLPTSGWDVHQPFGGFKDSGSPFKEQGLEGLGFYTRTKTVAVRSWWSKVQRLDI